ALHVLSAENAYVLPGFIDPHAHFLGAGGESGPDSRMPEMSVADFFLVGITTAVGCLGTDSVTRTLPALLGKARELQARGLTAFLYTGAFQVPPPTLTGNLLHDLVWVPEFIGIGEVAIADFRSSHPSVEELA